MMSVVAGAMALAVLDAVVSRQSAASNVGGWFESFGNLVRDFLSPAVPAFSTTATTSASAPAPAAARPNAPPGAAPNTTPAVLTPGGTVSVVAL